MQVAINADMGESFGHYQIGNDDALMQYLSSVNLACGFHAGDPVVMRHSVETAAKYGVSIGAHPGFQDKQGFGRRMLDVSENDLYCDLIYQFGALDAFVKCKGLRMTHVCPHGVMDSLVSDTETFSDVFMQAVKDYQPDLKLVIDEKSLLAQKCAGFGLEVASVGYPDLDYDHNGNLLITRERGAMDVAKICEKAVMMVTEHRYLSVDGTEFSIRPDVLCFHSDVPNSLEILSAVRTALLNAGVDIATL